MVGEINPTASRAQTQTIIDQMETAAKGAGVSEKTKELLRDVAAILSSNNVKVTNQGGNTDGTTEKKTSGATSTPALDNPDDLKAVQENLEKLIAYLKLDNDERQSEMAKDRIETQKATFEREHANRQEKIKETINKMEEAERTRKAQRVFGWLMAALAVVVAVVACVATGGLAVGPVIGAIVAVGCQVLSETGVMDDITEKLAEALEPAFGKEASKIIAQVAICLAILAVSLGTGFAGASAIAEGAKAVANVIRVATTVIGLAALGTSVAGVVQNYKAGTTQADLTETEKFLAILKQRMEESEEELNKILQAIQNSISQIADMLSSSTDTSDEIANKIGQMA